VYRDLDCHEPRSTLQAKKPLFAHWTGIAGFYIALILSAIANHYGVLKTW
jgi:hypothetical protein